MCHRLRIVHRTFSVTETNCLNLPANWIEWGLSGSFFKIAKWNINQRTIVFGYSRAKTHNTSAVEWNYTTRIAVWRKSIWWKPCDPNSRWSELNFNYYIIYNVNTVHSYNYFKFMHTKRLLLHNFFRFFESLHISRESIRSLCLKHVVSFRFVLLAWLLSWLVDGFWLPKIWKPNVFWNRYQNNVKKSQIFKGMQQDAIRTYKAVLVDDMS